MVCASHYANQSNQSALRFAQAVIAESHAINGIFFYQEAVTTANRYNHPPSDEPNITQAWQTLAQEHQVPLLLCITAAEKRGIIGPDTHPQASMNIADGFQVTGMAEFASLAIEADRVIQFK